MVWNKHDTKRYADGFTLLEVLISIFILGTGILSVFSLFMAGRSLQAYYHRHNAARNYASSTAVTLSNTWVNTGKRWIANNTNGGSAVPFNPVSPPTDYSGDTYLIDPVGLNRDATGGLPGGTKWNVAFSKTAEADAVARISIPSPEDPKLFTAETLFNTLAGIDDIEYELSNPGSPDKAFLVRSFYGGRQQRNQDYHHALLMTPDTGAILVFKNRVVPSAAFDGLENGWPLGTCRITYNNPKNVIGYITALEDNVLDDDEDGVLDGDVSGETRRKCLRPKQWAIIRGLANNSFRFARLTAVIQDDKNTDTLLDDTYTLVFAENLEGDEQFGNIDTSSGVECYFYSSLIHVAPYTEP